MKRKRKTRKKRRKNGHNLFILPSFKNIITKVNISSSYCIYDFTVNIAAHFDNTTQETSTGNEITRPVNQCYTLLSHFWKRKFSCVFFFYNQSERNILHSN